jgi:SAM-dependent methyltransferase
MSVTIPTSQRRRKKSFLSGMAGHILSRFPPEYRDLFYHRLHRLRNPVWTGNLSYVAPVTRWGFERGMPIDRFYIERFLEQNRSEIRGKVLEVRDPSYTQRYGTGVTHSDVLDIDASNPYATVITDLAAADSVPSEFYDCFILTQTLQYIYQLESAVSHAHRVLRPGGTLLVTVPGIIRIDVPEADYWRFTPALCQRLFSEFFGEKNITVTPHGNCVSAVAFLAGMAQEEMRTADMERQDSDFPVIISVVARKA